VKPLAPQPSADRVTEFADLVEQLTARVKAGEAIDLDELAAEHPAHADELRRIVPAMKLLADLSQAPGTGSGAAADAGMSLAEPLGDFLLLREVGRGGMGIVYEAQQRSLNRRVALKVLPFAATMDTKQLQRFKNEALAAATLRHEHIVHVYGVGCERGVHYYAMEFIDGLTLAQVIAGMRANHPASRERQRPEDARPEDATADFPPLADAPGSPTPDTAPAAALTTQFSGPRNRNFYRTAARLIAEAATALEHAHSLGIVHRDVKPANLIVDQSGKLWVTDFGLARFGPDAGLTMTGDLLGTLRYMAPEQALARHGLVDHRADVYSLGATLYELLTLRPALDGTDRRELLNKIAFEEPVAPRKLDRTIPEELETVTLKALAKEPAGRYGTAHGLAEDLRRFLDDRPIQARRPTLAQRARKWSRRHRGVVGAAVCGAVILLATVAALLAVNNAQIRQEQARTKQEKKNAEEARQLAEKRAEEVRQGLARLKGANALLDRGRHFVYAWDWDDAHGAFSQAIQLRPDHVSVWMERADLYTRLGLWDLAAADYAREMELREPDTTIRWYQHAVLRLAIGDEEGCRKTAQVMRERFAGTRTQSFAEETVRSSLLVPDPAVDLARLIALCREALPTSIYSMPYILGTAHYRAGQHDEAIRRFKEGLAVQPPYLNQLSYPVMAMAHHRLGHDKEARQFFEKATAWIEKANERPFALEDWLDSYYWWGERVEVEHLRREAEALLKTAPQDKPEK